MTWIEEEQEKILVKAHYDYVKSHGGQLAESVDYLKKVLDKTVIAMEAYQMAMEAYQESAKMWRARAEAAEADAEYHRGQSALWKRELKTAIMRAEAAERVCEAAKMTLDAMCHMTMDHNKYERLRKALAAWEATRITTPCLDSCSEHDRCVERDKAECEWCQNPAVVQDAQRYDPTTTPRG